jgi:SnoaL-like domain
MGVAQRFYDAFMVRDWYTMGLLYAEHATFSDPVFPLLNAKATRLMWRMLLSRAEDLGLEVDILEDSPSRARVNWIAHYTFTATGRPVSNRISTEMQINLGKIVRQVDTFSMWRWSQQALGAKGLLLGWTPLVRNKVQQTAAASLTDFARKLATNQEQR